MRFVRHTSWTVVATCALALVVLALLCVQIHETARGAEMRVGAGLEQDAYGVHVFGVVDDSPAERAGIRAGDRLLAVGGTNVATLVDYDDAARRFRRGQAVALRVAREGSLLDLEVLPGTPAPWWGRAANSGVILLCLAVGALSLIGRSGDVRARLLAALFFLIAFEFALPLGLSVDSAWPVVAGFAFYLSTGAQLALELHLAATISGPLAWPARRRGLIAAFYVIGAAIVLVGSLTYLLELTGHALPWGANDFDGGVHRFILPVWAGGLVALLLHGSLRASERRGRMQSALVLVGVLPWTVYVAVAWFRGFPGAVAVVPGEWEKLLPLLMLCYPIAVFVAVFRYHLFNLELVVRRSLVYTLLTTLLVPLFYAALGAATALLAGLFQDGVRPLWRITLAAALLGLLFAPLRRFAQRCIDRRFFPEREAARRRLIELAVELPALGDARVMARHLVSSLRGIFRARSATLLLADAESDALVLVAHDGPEHIERRPIASLDDPALAHLLSADRPLPVSDLVARSPSLRRRFRSLVPQLALALSIEGRLVGVLLLGRKHGDDRYSREEMELLRLQAHHVASVLDNARLVRSVTYEGLTGLLRREAILDLLAREIERARRYRRPLSVALVDIDHFKVINDTHGHLEGDRALRRVAAELQARVRSSDGVGRYGGEEFLLVFPETDLDAAVGLSETLRAAVERIDLRTEDGSRVELRVSIGVASLAGSSESRDRAVSELVRDADRELYRAKRAGRNRVEAARVPIVSARCG